MPTNSQHSTDQGGSGVVAGHLTPVSRSSHIFSSSKDAVVHRCIDEGLRAHLQDLVALGTWSQKEKSLHINILEVHTVLLALHVFQDRLLGRTVGLMCDTTLVVAYINKQGETILSSLYLLVRQALPSRGQI